jgi:putative inorganic carbon (HCO3(-)) transporter
MLPERAAQLRQLVTWCLALTAAGLPLYVVRFHVGPLPTTLLEAMIGVTVVAYALSLYAERRLPSVGTPYNIPIVLLLLAGIGGIAMAPDHTRALGIYRAYFIEAIAIFYIAVDTIRTREQLWLVLIVAGAGDCLFAIGQIVTFANALAHHAVHIDAGPAFLNTSANDVALYLEPPIAFAVGLSIFLSDLRQRLMALACALLFLVAILLSLSRASYLALVFLVILAILSLPGTRLKLWAIAGVALIALAVFEVPLFSQRLGTLAHSAGLRLSIYTEALRMLKQRPVFGAGISGFPIRVAPFRNSGEEIELYPHNLWLTTWSELGLLGVISFAVIFFGLLWRGIRQLSSSAELYKAVIWGSVAALVLYLVHGMFDSPYWKNDLSVMFWLVAALQVIAIRSTSRQVPTGQAAATRSPT